VRLDIFTKLAQGPSSAEEVAERCGGDARAFGVFLDALTGIGLVEKRHGRFSNTPFAQRHLVEGGEDYRGDQLVFDDRSWDLWGRLEETLMSGSPGMAKTVFESSSEAAERLLLGLHRDALSIAPGLAERLPLGDCEQLLDVGGGAGTYAVAFCRHFPKLRATIFDLPMGARLARLTVREAGMSDRIQVIEGNFLKDPLPRPYDAVFASNVLHSNGPDENRQLLRRVADCLTPGGIIVVRDILMNDELTQPVFGSVFSVNMLLHTPLGRCYAQSEIFEWLAEAGFVQAETVEPESVITAVKPRG
jgi:SAM-dependent methyltransferase